MDSTQSLNRENGYLIIKELVEIGNGITILEAVENSVINSIVTLHHQLQIKKTRTRYSQNRLLNDVVQEVEVLFFQAEHHRIKLIIEGIIVVIGTQINGGISEEFTLFLLIIIEEAVDS